MNRAALQRAHPQLAAPDSRLTPQGQQLSRLLRLIAGVGTRVLGLLPPEEEDRVLLSKPIKEATATVCRLATSLGPLARGGSASASGEVDAPGSS